MTLVFKHLIAVSAIAAIATSVHAQSAKAPAVKTESGMITGVDKGSVQAYLGIPYAAPPVGELRWQAPRSPEPWKSVLRATRFGNECPQKSDLGVFGKAGGREDCLYLNVFVGEEAARRGRPLPVFVWIYGGSLLVGAADDYDATRLATEGGAIVVTFNYRVGLLGFFAHPSLSEKHQANGNFGLLDQQFALQWVQRNIAAFGGDTHQVTIAGESSGGSSVYSHLVSPGSANLFQRAIAMSGSSLALNYPRFGSPTPLADAMAKGVAFAAAAGCKENSLECLRKLSAGDVLKLQGPYTTVTPIIDGQFLPLDFKEAFQTGKFNHVPLIHGSTRDEARFFAALGENGGGAPMQPADYPKVMGGYFGAGTAKAAILEYPLEDYNTPSEAYAAAVTDYFFTCVGFGISRLIGDQSPNYVYEFADQTAPSYLKATSYPLGAAHTYELPYLFPGFHGGAGITAKLNQVQEKLASQMVRYWTHAGPTDPAWQTYDTTKDNVMRFTLLGPQMATGRGFRKVHHCDFWDRAGVY